MCGRYSLEVTYDLFASRYGLEFESIEYQQRQEIFPTQKSPILLSENQLEFAKWGFKNEYSSQPIINSRLETVTDKKMFQEPFTEGRCLIPATSFFEWQKVNQDKIKRKIFVENQFIFSMAGISKKVGQHRVYSILTMEANEAFKDIHHRMPVILNGFDELKYLNKNTSLKDVLQMCVSANQVLLVR